MDLLDATLLAALAAAQAAGEAALEAPQAEAVDFSVMAMFLKADWVVQSVMVLLVLASFWSWAIIVEKSVSLRRMAAGADAFEARFWSGQPLDELHAEIGRAPGSPIERVFVAGMREWRRSFGEAGGLIPGTQARVDRAMTVAIARESERMTSRLSFLATTGSVSPFVGLFATVWGIKNSFESIAIQQNTNLAVVAPGIAEALLATALGLLAAIPAVVAYNRLSAVSEGLAQTLENFADEFSTILAREIDRATVEAA